MAVSLLEVGPAEIGTDRRLTVRLGLAFVAKERERVLHGCAVNGHLCWVTDGDVVTVGLHACV